MSCHQYWNVERDYLGGDRPCWKAVKTTGQATYWMRYDAGEEGAAPVFVLGLRDHDGEYREPLRLGRPEPGEDPPHVSDGYFAFLADPERIPWTSEEDWIEELDDWIALRETSL